MIERGQSRPKMEDREIRGWETGGGENGAIIHTLRCTERTQWAQKVYGRQSRARSGNEEVSLEHAAGERSVATEAQTAERERVVTDILQLLSTYVV